MALFSCPRNQRLALVKRSAQATSLRVPASQVNPASNRAVRNKGSNNAPASRGSSVAVNKAFNAVASRASNAVRKVADSSGVASKAAVSSAVVRRAAVMAGVPPVRLRIVL